MHGLAPGRKRAYMLYKAALKDTCSTNSSLESGDDTDLDRQSSAIAPHPYFMALGVLSIQKVMMSLWVILRIESSIYVVFDCGLQ